MIKNFLQELRTQRWDDHRFYHHSRINQSLHFVSACTFLTAYVILFVDPAVASLSSSIGVDGDNPTLNSGRLLINLKAHAERGGFVLGVCNGFQVLTELGLLPGAGGISRLTRMLGIQAALMGWILPGAQKSPAQALETGVVDEVVESPEVLLIRRGGQIGRAHV